MKLNRRAGIVFKLQTYLRLDGNLENAVAMLGKESVGIGNLIESKAVRQ